MDPESEEEYIIYGDPLPEIEDDEIPTKKCIRPEDQIVTDEKGRRRFHGAFTGGFSAGYYNTVGSVEGWNPASFQSSRSSRKVITEQQPEDFMDNEDLGQFGIAPRTIHATKDFNDKDREKTNKRSYPSYGEGPIPGIPPLRDLVIPSSDTVGIRLLKKMGWKHGQGIGPRVSKKQKKKIGNQKVYGCSLPGEETEESDDEYAANYTFAPADVDEVQYVPKTDLKGLDYVGLDKNPVLGSHFSLFGSAPVKIGTTKKLNIRGQAFGVGVYEDEDEDIYSHEDLSQYDFSLDDPAGSRKKENPKSSNKLRESSSSLQHLEKTLEGFRLSHTQRKNKHYPLPTLPQGFKPVHAPVSSVANVQPTETEELSKHVLSSAERSVMLGEKQIVSVFDLISAEDKKRLESIKQSINSPHETKPDSLVDEKNLREVTPTLSSPKTEVKFKPFTADPVKQKRYEQFLYMLETNAKDKFPSIQPLSMTEWEKVREQEEFQKAARLYQPLSAGIASRFVSASSSDSETRVKNTHEPKEEKSEITKAIEEKRYGSLTREKIAWHPDKLLCRRFNVPDPYPDSKIANVPKVNKEKISIFNFEHHLSENETKMEKYIPEESVIDASEEKSQTTETAENVQQANTTVIEDKDIVENVEEPLKRPSMDLFKAIFQSSDDESDSSSDEMESKKTTMEASLTEDIHQPVINLISARNNDSGNDVPTDFTSSSALNNKERTELTKSLPVQGVFSNIDLDELCKPQKTANDHQDQINLSAKPAELSLVNEPKKIPDEDMLYGPKLPPRLSNSGDENVLTKSTKKNKKHKKHKHKHKHKHRKSKSTSESENDEIQILRKLKKFVTKK